MDVQKALSFMFHDPRWQQKLLIAAALAFASFIVPVIPLLFVGGYVYRIMDEILRGSGEPILPEWDDWTKLLIDGLRYFGVLLLYALPAVLLFILGYGLMMVFPFLGVLFADASGETMIFVALQIIGMLAGFGVFALAMLLTLVMSVFSPLALCNLAAKNRFTAAFQPGDWRRVLRANPGGYFLAWVITLGMSFVTAFLYQILYLTIIFCCLLPFFLAVASAYLSITSNSLFALAYREGINK